MLGMLQTNIQKLADMVIIQGIVHHAPFLTLLDQAECS